MSKSLFGGTTQQIVLGLGAALMFIMAIEASQRGFGGGSGFFGWDGHGALGWHGATLRQENDVTLAKVHENGCRIRLEKEGEVVFTEDERDIASLGERARLELEVRGCGEKFELAATPGSGAPAMAAKLAGKEVPWNDVTRARFHDALQLIFETTGFDAEGRVDRFYARGGAAAVLEAAARMRSDAGQRRFLETLLAKEGVTAEEAAQVWRLAGKELGSDYELAQMIEDAPARHNADPQVQQAVAEALRSLASDYELRRSLDVLLDRGVSPETLEALIEVAADKMNSDYEQAEFLIRVARQLPEPAPLPSQLGLALRTVNSDHELGRALDPFLRRDSLSRADLDRLLEVATTGISSDYELAELLIQVASDQKKAEPWPPSVRRAIDSISSDHEQRRASEAFGSLLEVAPAATPLPAEAAPAPDIAAPQ